MARYKTQAVLLGELQAKLYKVSERERFLEGKLYRLLIARGEEEQEEGSPVVLEAPKHSGPQ